MTELVADAVARFIAQWRDYVREGGAPPCLTDFVPRAAHARRAALIELVRADLRERAARPGLAKDIDDYRGDFPELSDTSALLELLHEHLPRPAEQAVRVDADTTAASGRPTADDTTRPSPPSTRALDSSARNSTTTPMLTSGPTAPGVKAAEIARARPGDLIDDFELRAELGTGASGRMFLARQISMQRLVALRLTDRAGDVPRPMARLDHPHIVRVYDQRPPGVDAAALVWMEFLPGGTAEHLLARRRESAESAGGMLLLRAVDAAMEARGEIPPSDSPIRRELAALSWPETVAWIGRGLATAIDHAARHGTPHRAIAPGNVVFTAEGVPKLADFALDPGPSDVQTDIYALGLLLWELLTGDALSGGDGPAHAGTRTNPASDVSGATASRLPADCPPALHRVLVTCLEPDPRRRWSDAAVLAQQLDLCLDRRARDLVDPPAAAWRRRLRRWRVPLVVAAIAVPNLLASLYNIDHNRSMITGRLSERTQEVFAISTLFTNVLFFGLAAIVLTYWSRRVITVPAGLSKGVEYPPEELARARRAAILLGDRSVLVAFGFWMLSAASYPVGVAMTGEQLGPHAFAHFLASHAVCGAIALAYPFFLVGFYIVRCVYPMLLGHGPADAQDVTLLRGLQRRCVGYLLVAASIPLLAVAGVTLLPTEDIARIIVVVRVLCIGSIVMFVASYLMFRAIERDLFALERVLTPALHTDAVTSLAVRV